MIDYEYRQQLLSSVLFEKLSAKAANKISKYFKVRPIKKGEYIYKQGEKYKRLGVVLAGKVKIIHSSPFGNSRMLGILGISQIIAGNYFLDFVCLKPRMQESVIAIADTVIAEANRSKIVAWLSTDIASKKNFYQYFARQRAILIDSLVDSVSSDITTRTAQIILELTNKFGTPTDHKIIVEHGITQNELAELVGTTRETINKILNEYTARNWLIIKHKKFIILDLEKLIERASATD